MKEHIVKSMKRHIATAQFEWIEFSVNREREIDYTDETERKVQEDKLRTDITAELEGDIEYVMSRLGLQEKRVVVKSDRPKPSALANTEL
jgi:hypothetical protein